MRRDIETYIHDMYATKRYKLDYEGVIYPTPDSSSWDVVKCTLIYSTPNSQERARQAKKSKKKKAMKSQRIKVL